jgi:hypothetical protein
LAGRAMGPATVYAGLPMNGAIVPVNVG